MLLTLAALCVAGPATLHTPPAAAQDVARAAGTELLWRWKKGDVHRYEARSTQRMRMKSMGVHLDVQAETESRFAQETIHESLSPIPCAARKLSP